MSEPNPQQKMISESHEGFYVVDAGPGTGKTFTIVNRYVNILKRPDIKANDLLLLTFTKNAAEEMEERIRERLSSSDLDKDTKLIQAGTFDSFCHSVVRESPESVSDFLGFKERLTRGAALIENYTLNKEYFSDFFDQFIAEFGDDYGDIAVIASTIPSDVYSLVNKLMAKGIVPLERGWFGGGDGRDLLGDTDEVRSLLEKMNSDPKLRKEPLKKIHDKMKNGTLYVEGFPESDDEEELPQDILDVAAFDSRSEILRFIHDVYYEYIRRSVSDDRLTFGLNSVFAFLILYSNAGVRNRMSCRYLMIDEFQDTNENQMMIALMLLKEPNLCVVGDWKQGIYGFRFVSIENIVNFDERASKMYRYLNDDVERIPFKVPKANKLSLNINYRSSQKVIDTSFKVLDVAGSSKETVHLDPETVVELEEGNKNIGDNTHVRYVQVPKADHASETVSRIIGYVTGDDLVLEGDELRRPRYGDIAVICRNRNMCRNVYEDAVERGVPAFLQGEVEIMSTREGKLLLSWLKFINNRNDPWGIVGILSDMGYSMSDVRKMTRPNEDGATSGIPG